MNVIKNSVAPVGSNPIMANSQFSARNEACAKKQKLKSAD